MPNFTQTIRANKLSVTGFVAEKSGTAPTSPVSGQQWTDTTVTPNLVRAWDGTTWVPLQLYAGTGAANYTAGNDTRLSDQRVPTDGSVTGGTAGTGVKIAANTITDVNVAAANKDGVAGTASLRTLGTGAQQAVSGTDARLSDPRTPSTGSVVDASVSGTAAIAESKLALASDAAAGTASRRTIGTGALQAMAGNTNLSTIAAPTGNVAMAGFKITGLGAPTANTDAARLVDVQGAAAGIDAQPSVRVASTANVAVATGLANGQVVDGVTLVTGDRVLLKNQTTASENGVYIAPATGAATRATDNISANTFWFAEEGTANSDTQWVVTTNNPITTGTTALTITQFGAATNYTGTAGRITVSGTTIDIAATYVGQTSITTLGTVTAGTWNATAIGLAYGGTGTDASTTAGKTTARANLNAGQAGYRAVIASALVAGTPLTITHNLNSDNCIAQVRDATSGEYVYMDIIDAPATPNTLTITSGIAYAANTFDIVIVVI